MRRNLILVTLFMLMAMSLFLGSALVMADAEEPRQKYKRTVLGKYITAQEAYAQYTQSQDKIKIVDCRTPEEYVYVGHAPMAYNIPCMLGEWDTNTGELIHKDNPDFEKTVQALFGKEDLLMVMCRSGSRSPKAVNRLAAIGYTKVYSIIDGFEGDKLKDKKSAYLGKRLRNGWRNAFAPWTYDLLPALVYHGVREIK